MQKHFKCILCQKSLPENMFYPNKGRPAKVDSRCIPCNKIREKEHRKTRVDYFRQYRQENLYKLRARWKVQYAIKKGLVIRGTCEACGDEKVEAHHDDHLKPLVVRWFCRKHHMQYELGNL